MSASAEALPIPLPAPVTMAVFLPGVSIEVMAVSRVNDRTYSRNERRNLSAYGWDG
jgi:hypothetical protein